MHHNNFGNFYTREIYAIPIAIGFIPIHIMSRMAIPIPMGMDSHGGSHSHAHLYPNLIIHVCCLLISQITKPTG